MQSHLLHLRPCINSSHRPFFRASGLGLSLRCVPRHAHNIARQLSNTASGRQEATASLSSVTNKPIANRTIEDNYVYHGPLTNAFRNLKLFSIASIGLSTALTPLLFIVESGLPNSARAALAGIALGTSGLSTSLVAWCARPYVTTMRRSRATQPGSAEEVELTTQSLFMKPRITKVYDPSFLIETSRPLAQWELASTIHLTQSRRESVGTNVHPEEGVEETVAETADENGVVLGRWIVRWGADGVGTCKEMGHVVRYFNVHEEMLQ